MNAHRLNNYKGTPYYRFTVQVQCNVGAHPKAPDITEAVKRSFQVIAPRATDALWLTKDELGPRLTAPTEFTTWGPGTPRRNRIGTRYRTPGKEYHHFMGWESLIGAQMFAERRTHLQEEFKWQD